MPNVKTYRIYSRWMAVALRRQGFHLIRTDINEYHPQFLVWEFEDNEELQAAITKLSEEHKRG